VNSPAMPDRFTRRPHRSCRPYWRAISRPLGSEPSLARLASAQCHACRRISRLALLRRPGSLPCALVPEGCCGKRRGVAQESSRREADGVDFPGWVWPRAAALRRIWRISSSYAAINANDGHAATARPVTDGSATATLPARLATLPATNNAHGNPRPGRRIGTRPAALWTPRRSCRPLTGASAPPPSPAGHAARPVGAYAGTRPFPRSARAAPRNRPSSTRSTDPPRGSRPVLNCELTSQDTLRFGCSPPSVRNPAAWNRRTAATLRATGRMARHS
jgi:hypothetical protein